MKKMLFLSILLFNDDFSNMKMLNVHHIPFHFLLWAVLPSLSREGILGRSWESIGKPDRNLYHPYDFRIPYRTISQ
jgi:hypothetical protein